MTQITHPTIVNSEGQAIPFKPTSTSQGIAPLNVFSDMLIYVVTESNNRIDNDERNPAFWHMSEKGGGLVLSFTTMRDLFLMRDMFIERVDKFNLWGSNGIDFDGMNVIGYPNAHGPGLVTWGAAAAVTRVGAGLTKH